MIAMDRRQRLAILADIAAPGAAVGIRKVNLPGGGSTNIMRVMQTNACSLSCGYCPTFCGGKVKRTALAPEEVATTFMEAHRKGLAQGLFLTSGVPGKPERMMDRMLASVEWLRRKEGYQGYVHIKLLPGAESAQVDQATRLANRVSVNLEGPADPYVRQLAREKDFSGDLLPKLELAGRLLRQRRQEGIPGSIRPAGTTTTPTSAPSSPSWARQWKDRRPRQRCESSVSTRPSISCASTVSDSRSSPSTPMVTSPWTMTPRPPGPFVIPKSSRSSLKPRRTSFCFGSPASGPRPRSPWLESDGEALSGGSRISSASAWIRSARATS